MTNNQSSIIDNKFKQFAQIAGSAQSAVFFQNRASSIKHQASSMQNKPNLPIVQSDVKSFITMNYAIYACLTKVKNKPNSNPILTKTNPIASKTKNVLKLINNNELRKIKNPAPPGLIIFLLFFFLNLLLGNADKNESFLADYFLMNCKFKNLTFCLFEKQGD
jgi:hypothetical protein